MSMLLFVQIAMFARVVCCDCEFDGLHCSVAVSTVCGIRGYM